MSFTDVPSNSLWGEETKFYYCFFIHLLLLPSMRGMSVTNHVNAFYLSIFFVFLLLPGLEMTEIFYNTSKDDNSTVRPHYDNTTIHSVSMTI